MMCQKLSTYDYNRQKLCLLKEWTIAELLWKKEILKKKYCTSLPSRSEEPFWEVGTHLFAHVHFVSWLSLLQEKPIFPLFFGYSIRFMMYYYNLHFSILLAERTRYLCIHVNLYVSEKKLF